MASLNPQQMGSEFGPPVEDPWSLLPPHPPLDRLLDDSLLTLEEDGPAFDDFHRYRGTMKFGHMALMGPPGRLQGGLHCVGRVAPILHRIGVHAGAASYPCAINVRLGKAVPLFEEVPYEATYRRAEKRWWFTSRFLNSGRLDAAAWSLPDKPLLTDEARLRWKERFAEARTQERTAQQVIMGLPYEGTRELFWSTIDVPAASSQGKPLHRFLTAEGRLGLAFTCYHVDIIGALAYAVERRHPHFTTHVALSVATDRIPAEGTLVCIADRTSRWRDPHSIARPVEIGGERVGTETLECLLADQDFKTVYAHGWVASHPIALGRMGELRDKFKNKVDGGALGDETRAIAEELRARFTEESS